MHNTDSSHDDGGTESCDASEGAHGQTGTGSDSSGQSMSSGNSGNIGNDASVNNGNIYQGTTQGGMQPSQSQETAFTGQAGAGMAEGESGSQNAYDVPRYTSEGHVLGRPEEENNPQSAGNVQGGGQIPQPGSFQDAYQQVPPQMQPQSMYNQVPPQQMVYQQNPAQPVYQQNPAQPVYQQNPAQPVYQQNPAQPVYQQNPYNTQYVPSYLNQSYVNQQTPPPPEEQSATGEKRHGQIMDVVNGIINGENPDLPKIIDLFESMDARFWKGAMIGAGIVLLATNETVKKTIGDVLSGIMGKSGKTETEKGENNV